MNRPNVLRLTFPNIENLSNWKPDPNKSGFRVDGLWILDRNGWYRLPGTPFVLAHVLASVATNGNWCIFTAERPGGLQNATLFNPKVVAANDSPAESIPYSSWKTTLSEGTWTMKAVSCQALTDEDVGGAIEAFCAEDYYLHRDNDIPNLIFYSLNYCDGRAVLPWLQRSLADLPGWLHAAAEPFHLMRWESIAQLINSSLRNGLITVDDESPLSADRATSQTLAIDLLLINRDWTTSRNAQNIALNSLSWLCFAQQPQWKRVVRGASPGLLEFLVEASMADGTSMGASNLLCQLFNHFDAQEFEQVDHAALTGLAEVAAAAMEAETPRHCVTLGPAMRSNLNTRDIFTAAEVRGYEMETWAEGLTQEQKDRLDEEAPDRFKCTITQEVMRRPYLLVSSGEVYERRFIRRYLADGHDIDPRTNAALNGNHQLARNAALEREIREWVSERI